MNVRAIGLGVLLGAGMLMNQALPAQEVAVDAGVVPKPRPSRFYGTARPPAMPPHASPAPSGGGGRSDATLPVRPAPIHQGHPPAARHSHVDVGVSFGAAYPRPYGWQPYDAYAPRPYWGPGWGYPYPPAVIVAPPPPPTVYIERPAEPAPPPVGYWYWCAEPQGWYPSLPECPVGWQPVLPRP